jgi:hemerythrin-like domain-containing protein
MTPVTDVLRREHYLFSRLLDGLEVLIRDRRVHDSADRGLAGELLRFFAQRVDGLHQDKEERVLFPRLLARSIRYRVPVLSYLSQQHRRDRRLLGQMVANLPVLGDWNILDTDPFVTQASVYLRFQRRHMRVEDEWLLPVVDQIFRPEDDRMVRAGFRRVEHAHRAAFEPEALGLLLRLSDHLGQIEHSASSTRLDHGISQELQLVF